MRSSHLQQVEVVAFLGEKLDDDIANETNCGTMKVLLDQCHFHECEVQII